MQIAKPQVHLRKNSSTGDFFIHVITWFDYTKFKSDGVGTIATSASNGAFLVELKVEEDSTVENMQLLTPVVHTVTLENMSLDTNNPFLDIRIINSSDSDAEMGRRKTHHADADDSSMPGGY